MMLVSDYFMNMILNEKFRNQAATVIAQSYAALLKAIPIDETATPASEVTVANGYIRQAVTFAAAAKGRILSSAVVQFPTPSGGDWAASPNPVIAVALMDQQSAGGNWLVAIPQCPMYLINGQPVPPIQIGGVKVGKLFGGC